MVKVFYKCGIDLKNLIDVLAGKIKHQIDKTTLNKKNNNPQIPTKPPTQSDGKDPNTNNYGNETTEKKKSFSAKAFREWVLVIASVALAYFTYELFVISTEQISVNDKTIHKNDSITKIALQRSKTADSLAEQALIHSVKSEADNAVLAIRDTQARERNTKRELRAYLMVNGFIMDKDILGRFAGSLCLYIIQGKHLLTISYR